jgi:uncharacterized protein (UPF0332 family)/predicted nucleotidyltransferase
MAKEDKGRQQEKTPAQEPQSGEEAKQAEFLNSLPKEARQKLEDIKKKLESLKDELLKKFDKYVIGVALLPPQQPAKEGEQAGEQPDKDKINVLILVDDSDSQTMAKGELRAKLDSIIREVADTIDKNLNPSTVILSELWQNCYDGKYELLQMIALGAPIYDKGMLSAIKIAEVHKTMVIKKFEKYIVSYVLAGSLVQGRATKTSDIDVWIVIDDTDVKKMTRAELKDKLRAIIIGMGIEAGEITGIRNKLNIQVYILTDFWDSLKEANPIIFTLLRDGVPFYDRGIFMPWKQLLKSGKIKPSAEAIDMFMSSGEQMLRRVELKLKEIGMEDIYYAILTPSQAALMMHGIPPPAPKETAELIRQIFVEKEKMFSNDDVRILENIIKVRKEIEHGTKKELTGQEVDKLLQDGERYLKAIKRLFGQIEVKKEKEDVAGIYESVVTVVRDILKFEGVEKVPESDIAGIFNEELVTPGRIPVKFKRLLEMVVKAKKDYDANRLSKTEVEEVKKKSGELFKYLVEYLQRKRGREIERAKIRVKHGEKFGEVLLLDNAAFIIHDIDNEERDVTRAEILPNGRLGSIRQSNLEELEKAVAKMEIPPKVFIKEQIFEDLKGVFGRDVEVQLNY